MKKSVCAGILSTVILITLSGIFLFPKEKVRAEVQTKTDDTYVEVNESNFPNEVFRDWVRKKADSNHDDRLSSYEISRVTSLYLSDEKLTSLKGIEFFTSLKTISCRYSSLTSLDISALTELKTIDLLQNKLTTLDTSNNTKLEDLSVSFKPRV